MQIFKDLLYCCFVVAFEYLFEILCYLNLLPYTAYMSIDPIVCARGKRMSSFCFNCTSFCFFYEMCGLQLFKIKKKCALATAFIDAH